MDNVSEIEHVSRYEAWLTPMFSQYIKLHYREKRFRNTKIMCYHILQISSFTMLLIFFYFSPKNNATCDGNEYEAECCSLTVIFSWYLDIQEDAK